MSIVIQNAYPTVSTAADLARQYVNDGFNNGQGEILTNQSPALRAFCNAALGELKRKLETNGATSWIVDNFIVTPITPVNGVNGLGVPDPSTQVQLSFQGYFDGKNLFKPPALPSNCLAVHQVWERQTGSNNPFTLMYQPMEGIASGNQGPCLGQFEYRGDSLWFPGATESRDLRLRYEAQIPFIPMDPEVDLSTIQIPILDSVDVIAYLIAWKYASARSPEEAPPLKAAADEQIRLLINRQVRRQQTVPYFPPSYQEDADSNGGIWGFGFGH